MTNSMEQSPREADSCVASKRNSPHFTEPKCSLPCSQPATCPYPVPEPTPYHHICLKHILISPSQPRRGLPNGLFPSGFHTKTVHVCLFHPTRATCLTNLTLLDLITLVILGEEYTKQEAPHYDIFSSLPPSNPQISSSPPFSRKP
jgi:hypothetical protein